MYHCNVTLLLQVYSNSLHPNNKHEHTRGTIVFAEVLLYYMPCPDDENILKVTRFTADVERCHEQTIPRIYKCERNVKV